MPTVAGADGKSRCNPMGDKSPKSVNKMTGQKQGKVDAEKVKRDAAEAARKAAAASPKK
jgi:hypothetical protein